MASFHSDVFDIKHLFLILPLVIELIALLGFRYLV